MRKGVLFQDDLGDDGHRARELGELDHGLISGDDPRGFEPANPLQACSRREADRLGEPLIGPAPVPLQGRQDPQVDSIQSRPAFGGH